MPILASSPPTDAQNEITVVQVTTTGELIVHYRDVNRVEYEITVPPGSSSGSGDMTKAIYDPDADGKIATAQLTDSTNLTDAISKKHVNTLDHSNSLDHAAGSDNQDLSGKVDKVTNKSLVLDTEISKIHSNTLDHDGGAQNTAIAGKANSTHSHATTDITGTAVVTNDSRLTDARTPTAHSHAQSDVTGLATILSGKSDTEHTHIGTYEAANSNIQTHVTSAHAPSNAQKNSDITKAEIEAKLTGELSSHSHAGGGGESEVIVVKVGDTSNATTTYANATGLSFTSVGSKTYIIEAWIRWDTSALTVGIKLSVDGPATPGFVSDVWNAALTTSLISGGGGNTYKVGGASASAFATTNNLAMLNILYRAPAGGGEVTIQFAAETTGTITIKDGSVLRYRQVN